MNFFDNKSFLEEERRNQAFLLVRGLREAITIAKRSHQPITYEQTLDMISDLDIDLYKSISELLQNKNESDTVKYYKQLAEAKSETGSLFQYTPEQLIKEDIKEHNELLNKSSDPEKLRFIKRKISELNGALEYFEPRRVSEHKILEHDFFLTQYHEFFGKKIYEDDKYKDYRLPDKRALRLRLLHPDWEEHILGADLIYEIFDLKQNRVRFVHLQYKTWENKVLYLNQGNIKGQLEKLELNLCKTGFCQDINGNKYSEKFRLPFCCGFIRPTDKIQNMNSKLVSTGEHIPVCEAVKYALLEGKLTRQNIRGNHISSKNFVDLFINNLLGSRWIQMTTLEEFYDKRGIPALHNRIRIHAQEIQVLSEEELNQLRE